METLELLEKTQDYLRNVLLEEMEEGIDKLLETINDDASCKATVYQFKGQYNEIQLNSSQGVLKYETKTLYTNKIRIELLALIEKLTLEDLSIENELFSEEEKLLILKSVEDLDVPERPTKSPTLPTNPSSPIRPLVQSNPYKKVGIGAFIIGALFLGYFVVVPKLLKSNKKERARTFQKTDIPSKKIQSKSSKTIYSKEDFESAIKDISNNPIQQQPDLRLNKNTPFQQPLQNFHQTAPDLVINKNTFTSAEFKTYQTKNKELLEFYPKINSLVNDLTSKRINDSKLMVSLAVSLENHKLALETYKTKLTTLREELIKNAKWDNYKITIKPYYDYKFSMNEKTIAQLPGKLVSLEKLITKIRNETNL